MKMAITATFIMLFYFDRFFTINLLERVLAEGNSPLTLHIK